MWKQRLMWIGWPAFLAAGVMEVLVFAAFDPLDLHWLSHSADFSRTAIYTVAFFMFWAIFAAAGYMTMLLAMSPKEINTLPSTLQ